MIVSFFALIGMAIEKEKISEIAKAIEKMVAGEIHIISFGDNPESVYSVMKAELQNTEEGVIWQ